MEIMLPEQKIQYAQRRNNSLRSLVCFNTICHAGTIVFKGNKECVQKLQLVRPTDDANTDEMLQVSLWLQSVCT